MQQSMRLLLGT